MGELGDRVGSAVEGSLIPRALDPDSGAKAPHPLQPASCLNCGTALVGAYCHACGQQAHLHRTIGAFMHDLLHGALHFEGKMLRTLPMLAVRPGTLTRRYIDGARARFVSPMALFLFSVFLMFAVFQALGITTPAEIRADANVAGGIEEVRAAAVDEAAAARAELDALPPGDPSREALEQRLAEAEDDLVGLERLRGLASGADGDGGLTVRTGIGFIDEAIIDKWRKQPELMLYKLQANSYKFSWLLVPLSVPFVWLLFAWKRRFNGYDHAIFVTYSLSFMSLLFVVLSLIEATGAPDGLLALAVATIPPVHIYRHLRGTYSLSRGSTLWRLLVLYAMIAVIIALFVQILLVLGAV